MTARRPIVPAAKPGMLSLTMTRTCRNLVGVLLAMVTVGCGGSDAHSTTESASSSGAEASSNRDPVLSGAPCARSTRETGLELRAGGLADPTASVFGWLTTEGERALCPGDGLVPADGFAISVEARANTVYVHAYAVGSDGGVLPIASATPVVLSPGERYRVPAGREEFFIDGESGTEYVVFVISRGPLSERDPTLAALVASSATPTADAAALRLPPRGEVAVDPAAHRIDVRGDVAVVPFPIEHRATSTGRTRGWVDPNRPAAPSDPE